ncbi:hypothetical protein HPB51_007355 [Rhipicephalus microplus]|uniref:Uncharacterized protein n=1 Tax=Rhipicephalus microplus TaxID=6941 RepID=A0A9J6ERX9_RHIMP|nr:hypothetical protein HPB51_007355 [Rhipicephalus microplus]
MTAQELTGKEGIARQARRRWLTLMGTGAARAPCLGQTGPGCAALSAAGIVRRGPLFWGVSPHGLREPQTLCWWQRAVVLRDAALFFLDSEIEAKASRSSTLFFAPAPPLCRMFFRGTELACLAVRLVQLGVGRLPPKISGCSLLRQSSEKKSIAAGVCRPLESERSMCNAVPPCDRTVTRSSRQRCWSGAKYVMMQETRQDKIDLLLDSQSLRQDLCFGVVTLVEVLEPTT